jgi:phospholipase/carboxylesterase
MADSSHFNVPAGPHQGQPVVYAGVPLQHARAAIVMLHGRGGTAADILTVAEHLGQPDFAFVAPEAADNVWYPLKYGAPLAANEPWLSSALLAVEALVDRIEEAGVPPERLIFLGFSQGACIALEFAARRPRRYGGVAGLSGALMGPPGTPRDHHGSLAGTPIFLGCGDRDEHFSTETVDHASEVMRRLGGDVTERIYPNMGHIIHQDELEFVREMMAALLIPD